MASEDIPLLDQVRVAAPCLMNWDDMVGGDRVRYCRSCELNVYNLSEMSRTEAEKLLKTHEGHLCVRYYRRADGKIMSNNCPVGLKAIRRVFLRQSAIVASLAGTLFGGLFAFARKSEPAHELGGIHSMPTMDVPAPEMGTPVDVSPPISQVKPNVLWSREPFVMGKMKLRPDALHTPEVQNAEQKPALADETGFSTTTEDPQDVPETDIPQDKPDIVDELNATQKPEEPVGPVIPKVENADGF